MWGTLLEQLTELKPNILVCFNDCSEALFFMDIFTLIWFFTFFFQFLSNFNFGINQVEVCVMNLYYVGIMAKCLLGLFIRKSFFQTEHALWSRQNPSYDLCCKSNCLSQPMVLALMHWYSIKHYFRLQVQSTVCTQQSVLILQWGGWGSVTENLKLPWMQIFRFWQLDDWRTFFL